MALRREAHLGRACVHQDVHEHLQPGLRSTKGECLERKQGMVAKEESQKDGVDLGGVT